MLLRRQASPLLTVALLIGGVWVYRISPFTQTSTTGSTYYPQVEAATNADTVRAMQPMIPPGFKPPAPVAAPPTSAANRALVTSHSSLRLADPQVAEKVQIAPTRREKIAQMVSRLNAEAEDVMQGAIRRWSKDGGVSSCKIPDFNNLSSPERQKIEAITRETEQQIAMLLDEEEQVRWRALNVAPPIGAAAPVSAAAPLQEPGS